MRHLSASLLDTGGILSFSACMTTLHNIATEGTTELEVTLDQMLTIVRVALAEAQSGMNDTESTLAILRMGRIDKIFGMTLHLTDDHG